MVSSTSNIADTEHQEKNRDLRRHREAGCARHDVSSSSRARGCFLLLLLPLSPLIRIDVGEWKEKKRKKRKRGGRRDYIVNRV